jgi:hypothetical protein
MVTIDNNSVSAYVKSIVIDSESRGNPIYWMTAVGTKVALQAIFSTLVSKRSVTVRFGSKEAQMIRDAREWNVTVPNEGKMHAIYKKLQSGLCAMVMYSSLAKADSEDNSFGSAVVLCREGENETKVFFHFLNSRIRIPLHESWKDWVWLVCDKAGSNMMKMLLGFGMKGFLVYLPGVERLIEGKIGNAIKKGILKVERG